MAPTDDSHMGPQACLLTLRECTYHPFVIIDPNLPLHCEQARYYRDRASAIRARLANLRDDEAFKELYLLAIHYERLAAFADASGSLASLAN